MVRTFLMPSTTVSSPSPWACTTSCWQSWVGWVRPRPRQCWRAPGCCYWSILDISWDLGQGHHPSLLFPLPAPAGTPPGWHRSFLSGAQG